MNNVLSKPRWNTRRGGGLRSPQTISTRTGQLAREIMSNPTALRFRSPYDERVELVKNTLTTYSTLDSDAAAILAVHVLHALDTIPEKVR